MPFFHAITSMIIILTLNIYTKSNRLFMSMIIGIIFGVGIDFDHLLWALIFDFQNASKAIITLNIKEVLNYLLEGSYWDNIKAGTFHKRIYYVVWHSFSGLLLSFLARMLFQDYWESVVLVIITHIMFDIIETISLQINSYQSY